MVVQVDGFENASAYIGIIDWFAAKLDDERIAGKLLVVAFGCSESGGVHWRGEDLQNTDNCPDRASCSPGWGCLVLTCVQRIATSRRRCGRRSALRKEGQNIVRNCTNNDFKCKKIEHVLLYISLFRFLFSKN
jgi:hypothetical protein